MTIPMDRKRPHWWICLLGMAALLIGIRAIAAEVAPPAAEPPPGQLLIASTEIQDPRFFHSVVLLLRHDRNGAFGIIINHPLGERSLAALLADDAGKDSPDAQDNSVE